MIFKNSYGTKGQISFNSEEEYYEVIGYLAKGDESSKIVYEANSQQGAWGNEGRILFYKEPPPIIHNSFILTAGNGNILYRTNCNEFVNVIIKEHNFMINSFYQDINKITITIPNKYIYFFNRGLQYK